MKSEKNFRDSLSIFERCNYREEEKKRKEQEINKKSKVSIFGRAKYGKREDENER